LINSFDPVVMKKFSGTSMISDLPCVNKRDDSDENPTSPSSCAESAPAVDIQPCPFDEILTTLHEIEQICLQLRDVAPVSPILLPTLLNCVHRPSFITPRSQMIFDASNGEANLTAISENVRRMIVFVFDYANTLKPIADILPEEKIALVRNCVTPFSLFMLSFYSAKSDCDEIFLPSGHTLGSNLSIFAYAFRDDKRHHLINPKVDIKNQLQDSFLDDQYDRKHSQPFVGFATVKVPGKGIWKKCRKFATSIARLGLYRIFS
uniref:NR LBD domain-containing protein n=1 Tax=Angiostrongylus cantonensis TaxID=6313 RepID=A0A0K0D5X9_ANGCA